MKTTKTLTSALILAFCLVPGVSADEGQTSYGYVRTLEGSGAIISADTDGVKELGLNQPVLSGDRLLVDPGSRVELVLPDFNIVRLGGDTELELSRLAFSAETEERVTTLLLVGGEMQIVITEYALGDELPAVVLPNATVFLHEPGSYRITAYQDMAHIIVREGYAEVSTERGSAIARSDEAVQVEGGSWPAVSVLEAAYPDDLEQWGEVLMAAAESAAPSGVDPALGYSASSLGGAGEWVEVEDGSAWSPYVEESWRPYTRGSWVTTPAGMHWVGQESWGWVTGHYGYWSQHGSYGWLWYPGAAWAPAWVHWYWGPNWVGWVPFGFYDGFYGNHLGLRLGYYGYAGGYWHHYNNWTFCPTYNLGHGGGGYVHGRDMPRHTGRTAVPRGVITTDTRGVNSVNWRDGVLVGETLTAGARRSGRSRESVDVTPFIARERDLDDAVIASVGSRERGTADSGRITRQPAARQGGGGVSISRQRTVAGRSTTGLQRSSDLAAARQQVWRDRTSGRRIFSVDRGAASQHSIEPGRQSAFESAGRVREAWRTEPSDRRGGYSGRGLRDSGSLTRGYTSRYGSSATRSSSPARRVIDGVRSPSRGKTSSRYGSRGSRSGSSRSTPSVRSNAGSRSAPRASSPRSSGSGRRPSASGRSSSSGRSKSSSGKASKTRSSGSRSKPKG